MMPPRFFRFLAMFCASLPACRTLAADVPPNLKLFLLAGQSNMAGRGVIEAIDRIPHPRVFVLNKENQWVPAVDPLHFEKPTKDGVGLASTFARALAAAHPEDNIGLVPTAFGGSSLDQWQPGHQYYDEAIARAHVAMASGHFAGILWHQGESDCAPELAKTYSARFAVMIAALRRDLGDENLPVLIGELGQFRPDRQSLNLILVRLPDSVPVSAFVNSDGLTDGGDKTHFDSASLREFGRRYAAAFLKLTDSAPVKGSNPLTVQQQL